MEGGKMTYEDRVKNLVKARAARKAKMSGGKMSCMGCKKGCSSCMPMKGGKMTYEDRCANLAKARKARKMGAGQYNQDYVDESQLNYAGSPLDMYFNLPEDLKIKEKQKRGENIEKKGGRVYMRGGETSDMTATEMLKMSGAGVKSKVKGKVVQEINQEEFPIDLDGAIEHLAQLASKFGLRIVKK
jgi:hypothetical protein